MHLPDRYRRLLLDAARDTIRRALRGHSLREPGPDELADPVLTQPAGCFVTLHRLADHELRGCVGRLDAVQALVAAVRGCAAGVLHDPRFTREPVTFEELPLLQIDISILSPLRLAPGPMAFDVLSEGIYLTCGERSGCFLPQVARETGWTKEQLLNRLCVEKMGLSGDAWKHPGVRLQVFTTLIVGPEAFQSPGGGTPGPL
jgi:AmmeMemoRadiSam system protein A